MNQFTGRRFLNVLFLIIFVSKYSLINEKISSKNTDGSTAVHAAAKCGNTKLMSMLIFAGGDLRLHDAVGYSIPDWAQKCTDEKKRKKMLDYLEKIKNLQSAFAPMKMRIKGLNLLHLITGKF